MPPPRPRPLDDEEDDIRPAPLQPIEADAPNPVPAAAVPDLAARRVRVKAMVDERAKAGFDKEHPFLPTGWQPPTTPRVYDRAEAQVAEVEHNQAMQQREATINQRRQQMEQQKGVNAEREATMRGSGQQFYTDAYGNLQPIIEAGTNKPLYHQTPWERGEGPGKRPTMTRRNKYGAAETKRPTLTRAADPLDDHLYADVGDGQSVPYMPIAEALKHPDIGVQKMARVADRAKRAEEWKQALAPMGAVVDAAETDVKQAQAKQAELQQQIEQLSTQLGGIPRDVLGATEGGFLGIGAKPTAQAAGAQKIQAQLNTQLTALLTQHEQLTEALKPQGALMATAKAARAEKNLFETKAKVIAYSDMAATIEERLEDGSSTNPAQDRKTLASIKGALASWEPALQRAAREVQPPPSQPAPEGAAPEAPPEPFGTPLDGDGAPTTSADADWQNATGPLGGLKAIGKKLFAPGQGIRTPVEEAPPAIGSEAAGTKGSAFTIPKMQGTGTAAGVVNAANKFTSGMTTPENAAILAATGGAGALAEVAAGTKVALAARAAETAAMGGFTGMMAKDTVTAAVEAKHVLDDPNATDADKADAVTSVGLSALMTVASGAGTKSLAGKTAKEFRGQGKPPAAPGTPPAAEPPPDGTPPAEPASPGGEPITPDPATLDRLAKIAELPPEQAEAEFAKMEAEMRSAPQAEQTAPDVVQSAAQAAPEPPMEVDFGDDTPAAAGTPVAPAAGQAEVATPAAAPKPERGLPENATPSDLMADMSEAGRELLRNAKAAPDEFTGIDASSLTASDRRNLARLGLSFSTDRNSKVIATYPAKLRAEDLRAKVTAAQQAPVPIGPRDATVSTGTGVETAKETQMMAEWRAQNAREAAEATSDLAQYQDVQRRWQEARARGAAPDSPEVQALWKENEEIKNRNGGMPPSAPGTAPETKPAPAVATPEAPAAGVETKPAPEGAAREAVTADNVQKLFADYRGRQREAINKLVKDNPRGANEDLQSYTERLREQVPVTAEDAAFLNRARGALATLEKAIGPQKGAREKMNQNAMKGYRDTIVRDLRRAAKSSAITPPAPTTRTLESIKAERARISPERPADATSSSPAAGEQATPAAPRRTKVSLVREILGERPKDYLRGQEWEKRLRSMSKWSIEELERDAGKKKADDARTEKLNAGTRELYPEINALAEESGSGWRTALKTRAEAEGITTFNPPQTSSRGEAAATLARHITERRLKNEKTTAETVADVSTGDASASEAAPQVEPVLPARTEGGKAIPEPGAAPAARAAKAAGGAAPAAASKGAQIRFRKHAKYRWTPNSAEARRLWPTIEGYTFSDTGADADAVLSLIDDSGKTLNPVFVRDGIIEELEGPSKKGEEVNKIAVEIGVEMIRDGSLQRAIDNIRKAFDDFYAGWNWKGRDPNSTYEEYRRSAPSPSTSDIAVKNAIAEAKKNGPSPEFRAFFGGIDPGIAGTTHEKVASFAKSLGLDYRAVHAPEAATTPKATPPETPSIAAKLPAVSTPEVVTGEPISKKWTAFGPESQSLGVPRAEMPQIKSEARGALVNFLKARGIEAKAGMIAPSKLKPTQAEFSPAKVQAAREHTGSERPILISADGHVIDGHHQWMAGLDDTTTPMPVIRLNAPVDKLLAEMKEFPSTETAKGAAVTKEAPPAPKATIPLSDRAIAALQKAKLHKPGQLSAATPFSLAYDGAIELAILGIRAGRVVADVVKLAIQRFKAMHPKHTPEELSKVETAVRTAIENRPPEPEPGKNKSKVPPSLREVGVKVEDIEYDVRAQNERMAEARTLIAKDGDAAAEQSISDRALPADTRVALGGVLIEKKMEAMKSATPEQLPALVRDIQRLTAATRSGVSTESGQGVAMHNKIYENLAVGSAMEYVRHVDKQRLEKMGGEETAKALDDAAKELNKAKTPADKEAAIEKLKEKHTTGPARKALDQLKRMEVAKELNELGVLTRDDLVGVAGNALGIPGIEQAKLKHIAELADQIKNARNHAERSRAELELADTLSIYNGVSALDLEASILTLNILSGPTTQGANIEGNALQMLSNLGTTALVNPTKVGPLVKGFMDGIGLGATQAKSILATGRSTRDFQDKTGGGMSHLANIDYARDFPATGKVAGAVLTTRARLVDKIGRFMKAADAVFYYPAREAYARLVATKLLEGEYSGAELAQKVRESLHVTPEAFDSARKQAVAEGYDGIDLGRRVSDIIEERRASTPTGKEVVKQSERFAAETTYTNEPVGLAGVLYRKLASTVRDADIGGVPVLKPWAMFLRTPANVFNATTNFTPLGATRAHFGMKGEKYRKGGSGEGHWRNFSQDERNRLYVQSIIGTTLMGGLVAQALKGKDDGGITASGPSDANKRRQLQQGGWIPFSFKVGDRYISYKDSPLLVPLAIVGHVADAVKYQKSKSDLVLESKIADAVSQAPQIIFQTSMLSGMADLMSSLSNRGGGAEAVGRTLGSIPANLAIPYNRLLQQVDQAFDSRTYDNPPMVGGVPFLRRTGTPNTDVQGRPQTYSPANRFASTENSDPVDTLLRAKNVFIPDVGKDIKIGNRVMTDPERDRYRQMSGQRIRIRLTALAPMLRVMSQEEVQKRIESVAREERERMKPYAALPAKLAPAR